MTTQQMDRLAAEKVMGLDVYSLDRDGYQEAAYPKVIENVDGVWMYFVSKNVHFTWAPSSNEQCAAMVREKMAADGWLVNTCVHDGEWSASVWR